MADQPNRDQAPGTPPEGSPTAAQFAAIIPAAGSGQRLGAGIPKALVTVAGRPLLGHAVAAVLAGGHVGGVVLVAPPGLEEEVAAVGAAAAGGVPVTVVPGGTTRDQSVAAGLAAVGGDVRFVLVHDAARALVPEPVVAAVVAALLAGAQAVVPGLPVTDTIRAVDADGRSRTLDRAALRAVQTPQGFPLSVLRAAHEFRRAHPDLAVTDDAGLAEALGVAVTLVPGDPQAMKVTTGLDLALAEVILRRRTEEAQ